jgi:hypothetical protein
MRHHKTASKRKRERQKRRHDKQKPHTLPPPISVITGEPQEVLQTPVRSDIRRISTAALIRELQTRTDSRGLIQVLFEQYN